MIQTFIDAALRSSSRCMECIVVQSLVCLTASARWRSLVLLVTCDMSDMFSVSSPPHASHPNIIGKPNSSHHPGHLESRREQMLVPSPCNNDGEVKMRNCNQAFLHFKCSLAQQNIIWNAMCTVWFIFFGRYLVLWSPKCLVTPSQVRPQPRIIINDLLMLESNSFKSQ